MGAPAVREFRIQSWDQFLEIIRSAPYSNWAFRGERHANWPLSTSLARYFCDFGIHRQAWPEQERRILRIFKRKAHQYLSQPPALDDDFQWLALMQHHGAPTRLLDFTWSPYVAAFFALERATAEAAVWALNPAELGSREARKPGAAQRVTLPEMDPRIPGNFSRYFLQGNQAFIWVGEPDTMNRRLIAQSGTFAVPGVLDIPIEEVLLGYPEPENMIAKIVLSANVRDAGLRELYRMNITYATLFPDLDGLARSLGYELEYHWGYDPRSMLPLER
ncbi:MAG TPA: FRG domain-containing protein [Bryobacteraceae bacterium]|nr:FRG domain-containing protein [Bryobacteraceae bacterium]